MPELPEVEQVRRGIEGAKLRAPVTKIWRSAFDLRTGEAWSRQREKLSSLRGTVPGTVARRGKYLLWTFEPTKPGQGQRVALIHLGMTGQCLFKRVGAARLAHTHVALVFEDGRRFDFVDPRRFGGFVTGTPAEISSRDPVAALGPEPLEAGFDAQCLRDRAGSSRRSIRAALLDQNVVAGLGNIYVAEVLFAAGVPPHASCRRLLPPAWQRIRDAIVQVLEGAISRGGTTLRDYRMVDGSQGRNKISLRVYARDGHECVICASTIQIRLIQGRSSFHCPTCQSSQPGGWIR